MNLPHGLRALRHRDFRLFFAGQGTSQLGTWLQLIATSWLVYRLSGSTFLLGLTAFAIQIPFLVLAPLAGVVVDRHDARRVLMITNSIASTQALVMFVLVATGAIQAWHLVAGNLVLGELYAVGNVSGTGASAQIARYPWAVPGTHVDGVEAWLYPIVPSQVTN